MLGAIVRRAIILSVVAARIMFAQSPTAPVAKDPPKYVPTEVQSLKLQVLQKDAQLAQVQLQRLNDALQQSQQAFQKALQALQAGADEVKKANGWPADTQFSQDQLTFSAPPTPPTPPAKPAEQPAPAKPKEKP
jgi:hypothetical protein